MKTLLKILQNIIWYSYRLFLDLKLSYQAKELEYGFFLNPSKWGPQGYTYTYYDGPHSILWAGPFFLYWVGDTFDQDQYYWRGDEH